MDEKVTKPTIETVLERMNGMEQRLGERIDALEERLVSRLDRIESHTNMTRADFLELRMKLREHLPALQ